MWVSLRHRPLCSCTASPSINKAKLVFSEPCISPVKMVTTGTLYVNIMHEVSLLLREFPGINSEAEDIEDLR